MKNIAKILCFVLSLVLVFSVIGVSAFAEESVPDGAVAKVGDQYYTDLPTALKAVNATNNVVDILSDVTITEYWDARYTGAKFTVPVTINGNGHTLKFTNTVYDGGNYMAAFRFEADAVVNDLTMDLSEALSGFATRIRAISAKCNLTVDGCTFIGNGSDNNTRAIIFGEGAGSASVNYSVSITDSAFEGWRRGLSDNENGQDVKSIEVSGCEFNDAAVNVSAAQSVTFTDNTVEGAPVVITSYTASQTLAVVATGNTLDADYAENTYIKAGSVETDDESLVSNAVAKIGNKNFTSLSAAVKAATEGDVIYVLDESAHSENVTVADGYRLMKLTDAEGKVYAYGYVVYNATPEIVDGNWWIGGVDTGIIAEPKIEIVYDANLDVYYWYINGVNTGLRADAVDGFNPEVSLVEYNGHMYWAIDLDGKGGEIPVRTEVKAEAIDGVGIVSVTSLGVAGQLETYEIVFSNGTKTYFTVTHGLNGQQGEVGPQGQQGNPGPDGDKGQPGLDGANGQDAVKVAIVVAAVCVLLTLSVACYRIFRHKSF